MSPFGAAANFVGPPMSVNTGGFSGACVSLPWSS